VRCVRDVRAQGKNKLSFLTGQERRKTLSLCQKAVRKGENPCRRGGNQSEKLL
jgi:hypothetical protein